MTKCRNCGAEIEQMHDVIEHVRVWYHEQTGARQCSFDVAEPEEV